jgi:DNA-binding GntR family transcriptional regulator
MLMEMEPCRTVIQPLDAQPALIDLVLDRLVAAIADGTLPPGERMTQETVAARLGVSRQPVSHALQVLRRRGLLVENGKRGLVVAPLDAKRLLDLYQVRAALDGLAARLAAQRTRAGLLPAKLREEAQQLVDKGATLATHAAIGDLIAADVRFHSLIHQMSGNAAIVETVSGEWPHFMRSMGVALADADIRLRIWTEHATILSEIAAGRPEPAERAAQRHTLRAGEDTARRLKNLASVA